MKNNAIYLFLIFTIINISSEENKFEYETISIISNSDLNPLSFNSQDKICSTYIPSLFNPIPLVRYGDYDGPTPLHYKINIFNPILEEIEFKIYNYNLLDNNININFGVCNDKTLDECYFGLSSGLPKDIELQNNTLDHLKITNQITEKKFSLDKWELLLDKNMIKSRLYLGYNHLDFNSQNKNYIGTCQNIKEDSFWGCYFKEMIFNNTAIPLNKSDEEDYKIYFSSEDYTIIFPKEFQDKFEKASNGSCTYNAGEKKTFCRDFFKKDYIIPLTLSNDNMDITLEIDYLKRFNSEAEQDSINMVFIKDIDYIIFPLIMLKNFHIQFDADSNIIRFYSRDKKILHVKIKEPEPEPENSSSALTIFLVILIILLLLGLVFGIFVFLKKIKNDDSKEINKFQKFEEDDNDDFKKLKEKKIY